MNEWKEKYIDQLKEGMIVGGVDEAGRGPLAGPVVAACVIFDHESYLKSVDQIIIDSKKMTDKKRLAQELWIKQNSSHTIIEISSTEIDEINVLQATMKAMRQSIIDLDLKLDLVYIDGNTCPESGFEEKAVIRGDNLIPAISAASILAKVHRDRIMIAADKEYPQYGFAKHKGYGTIDHLNALEKYGPCPIHRFSYMPIKKSMEKNQSRSQGSILIR